jgi:hypothetical protein
MINSFKKCLRHQTCTTSNKHYCIGTKDIPRIIGEPRGVIVTGTVDSSHASHDDLKGHSAYSLHIGGGGAFQFETKKHTVHAASSAESGDAIIVKEIKWTRNFCEEMGYDQKDICPNGTLLGQDNMSAMKILASDTQTGKTKHMDLRIKIQRESRKNKIVQTSTSPLNICHRILARNMLLLVYSRDYLNMY